jgi:hypothetical protein
VADLEADHTVNRQNDQKDEYAYYEHCRQLPAPILGEASISIGLRYSSLLLFHECALDFNPA